MAILLMIIALGLNAQITQLELTSGLKKTDFTSFSLRSLAPGAKLAVATLGFFQKYHQQEDFMFDEAGVQSTIYWNLNESFSIGPGLYYNSVAGFSKRLSMLYAIRSSGFVMTAIPSIAYADKTGFINGELLLLAQWTRPIKKDLKLLLSAQILTYWDQFSTHSRSFQQVRAGFDKQAIQFGLAVDLDQYGTVPITRTSVGVFVRKIFLNN